MKFFVTQLKQIKNPKGDIFHILKKSENSFNGFGEAYFSFIKHGEIKGWKKHLSMTLNLVVPIGKVKFVIFDEILNAFYEFILSPDNYRRLTIKPGLWFAFQGKGKDTNLVLNIADIEHNQSEVISKGLKEINYEW